MPTALRRDLVTSLPPAHFIDDETEAQRGQATCLRSRSEKVAGTQTEPDQF